MAVCVAIGLIGLSLLLLEPLALRLRTGPPNVSSPFRLVGRGRTEGGHTSRLSRAESSCFRFVPEVLAAGAYVPGCG